MADLRKFNGGHSTAGRKNKEERQKLVERLSPLDDIVFTTLKEALKQGEPYAIKLFFEYRYGKAKTMAEVEIYQPPLDFKLSDYVTFTSIDIDE